MHEILISLTTFCHFLFFWKKLSYFPRSARFDWFSISSFSAVSEPMLTIFYFLKSSECMFLSSIFRLVVQWLWLCLSEQIRQSHGPKSLFSRSSGSRPFFVDIDSFLVFKANFPCLVHVVRSDHSMTVTTSPVQIQGIRILGFTVQTWQERKWLPTQWCLSQSGDECDSLAAVRDWKER